MNRAVRIGFALLLWVIAMMLMVLAMSVEQKMQPDNTAGIVVLLLIGVGGPAVGVGLVTGAKEE